jgi:DNA-directed RNA polymerase specialized sigma24 family protein
LWKAVGDVERQFAHQAGAHRIVAEFPELNRDLVMIDPESAAQVPASAARRIFHFRQPLQRLARSDQAALLATLKGLTDEEPADTLGLTLSAVKVPWRSIFARIAAALPRLASRFQNQGCTAGRSGTAQSSACAIIPKCCGRGSAGKTHPQ